MNFKSPCRDSHVFTLMVPKYKIQNQGSSFDSFINNANNLSQGFDCRLQEGKFCIKGLFNKGSSLQLAYFSIFITLVFLLTGSLLMYMGWIPNC